MHQYRIDLAVRAVTFEDVKAGLLKLFERWGDIEILVSVEGGIAEHCESLVLRTSDLVEEEQFRAILSSYPHYGAIIIPVFATSQPQAAAPA